MSLKIPLAAIFFAMFHGKFITSLRCRNFNMAPAEEFSITPYSFEPEYSTSEESPDSTDEDESENIDEERIERLVSLEWCTCENCDTETLNKGVFML